MEAPGGSCYPEFPCAPSRRKATMEKGIYARIAEIVRTERNRNEMSEAVWAMLRKDDPQLFKHLDANADCLELLRVGIRETVGATCRARTAATLGRSHFPGPIQAGRGASQIGAAFTAIHQDKMESFFKKTLLPDGRKVADVYPADLLAALPDYEGKDVGVLQKRIFLINLYNEAAHAPDRLIPESVSDDTGQEIWESAAAVAARAIQGVIPAIKPAAVAS